MSKIILVKRSFSHGSICNHLNLQCLSSLVPGGDLRRCMMSNVYAMNLMQSVTHKVQIGRKFNLLLLCCQLDPAHLIFLYAINMELRLKFLMNSSTVHTYTMSFSSLFHKMQSAQRLFPIVKFDSMLCLRCVVRIRRNAKHIVFCYVIVCCIDHNTTTTATHLYGNTLHSMLFFNNIFIQKRKRKNKRVK